MHADNATGDDVASTQEDAHRDGHFIWEETQTLHELAERRRRWAAWAGRSATRVLFPFNFCKIERLSTNDKLYKSDQFELSPSGAPERFVQLPSTPSVKILWWMKIVARLPRDLYPAWNCVKPEGKKWKLNVACFSADSVVHGPLAVPHLVPLLMAMEGDDPVENSERGCQLLYGVLQAARSAALHARDYQQHAQSLLTGTHICIELHLYLRSHVFSL